MAENTREQSRPSAEQLALRKTVAELREREGWVDSPRIPDWVCDRATGAWFTVLTWKPTGEPAEVFEPYGIAKPANNPKRPWDDPSTRWFDLANTWVWNEPRRGGNVGLGSAPDTSPKAEAA